MENLISDQLYIAIKENKDQLAKVLQLIKGLEQVLITLGKKFIHTLLQVFRTYAIGQ